MAFHDKEEYFEKVKLSRRVKIPTCKKINSTAINVYPNSKEAFSLKMDKKINHDYSVHVNLAFLIIIMTVICCL